LFTINCYYIHVYQFIPDDPGWVLYIQNQRNTRIYIYIGTLKKTGQKLMLTRYSSPLQFEENISFDRHDLLSIFSEEEANH
jgi:hypothetical protein